MTLLARDVMQRDVLTVTPGATLAELADLLVRERIGGVPVVESDAVVGVVSRSDFARFFSLERSLAELAAEADGQMEFAPNEAPEPVVLSPRLEGHVVRDVMVSMPVTVTPETPIKDIADALVKRHLHRVLVVEGKALRGIITSLDIVRLVASGKLHES